MLTDKQKEYCKNSKRRWNFKVGAVRSGKSYVDIAVMIPYRILERRNKGGLNFILGVSKSTIERNVLQPMREIYGDSIGQINSQNIALLFGEPVYCLGAEKISQVAKLQGASVKYCYIDEVCKINESVFEMLKSRLDKPYSVVDGACNPEEPTHWFRKFLQSDVDIYEQHYTIDDNSTLSDEFVDNLKKEYQGTIYYDRLILGMWKRAEGVIYKAFADNPDRYKMKDGKEITEIIIGIDFGGNKSGHSFVATGHDDDFNNIVALASERHAGEKITPIELENLFIKFAKKVQKKYGNIDYIYYDNAESVLGRMIEEATDREFPQAICRGAWKRPINDRIRFMLRLMSLDRFFYTDDCETLKEALSTAVWDKKSNKDVRLDDFTSDIDTLDAFEYTFERDMTKYIEE